MTMRPLALAILSGALLSACSGDDNDDKIRALESQIDELTTAQANAAETTATENAALRQQIAALQTELDANDDASSTDRAELQTRINALLAELNANDEANSAARTELQASIDALTAELNTANEENAAEQAALQTSIDELTAELNQTDTDNATARAALQAEIDTLTATLDATVEAGEIERNELQGRIDGLVLELDTLEAEIAEELEAMQTLIDELLAALDALTAEDPVLGAQATTGANLLASDNADNVWRFAIFPDTQGRDDDNMKTHICTDADGNPVTDPAYPIGGGNTESRTVCEWIGVDYNKDGFYDAGTESQALSVKPGDWDEDGVSYLVNVEDPFHPFIVTDENGPVVIAPEDRQDYGPDWKILPVPLVDAVTDKIIELDVDLVLAIGDMTEYRAESDYIQWMETAATPLQEAGIDIFPVRGNHEIINGRNWLAWFNNEQEWERQSVNNVYNDINVYEGKTAGDYDQGLALYQEYVGQLTQEHLDEGKAIGLQGAEDLNYYFIHNNTLFIAIDFYFGDLYTSAYKGTWLALHDWLHETIKSNAEDVDHIVVYGHEAFASKKRPIAYDVAVYQDYVAREAEYQAAYDEAQAAYDAAVNGGAATEDLAVLEHARDDAADALEMNVEPSLDGLDIGQLGYLLLQDDSEPGLAESILDLFTQYKVTYLSGHDHQYSRSLMHSHADDKDSANGFTQIIGGNASWKSYEGYYGIHDELETGLFIKNFVRDGRDDKDDLVNTEGRRIASHTDDLGRAISFVLVEVNGRQITTTAYYANHDLTEVDMNLGAHYDYDTNQFCEFDGDYLVANSTETTEVCTDVEWYEYDENTRTTDAVARVVEPEQNYFLQSSTPEDDGYIGSEASIFDGYNMTFNSFHASALERTEMLREMVTMSWFADDDAATVSDILLISGNQTQEGIHTDSLGNVMDGESESITYINRSGCEVLNSTHVNRDGITNKGTDFEASLSGDLSRSNYDAECGGNSASWTNRFNADGLDFADAMALGFTAPADADLDNLVVGRYDEGTQTWVPAFPAECYTDTGYSEHYSVHYRIAEQEPEGGLGINGCQQRYWGYHRSSHSIWGFIHTDGKYAIIERN